MRISDWCSDVCSSDLLVPWSRLIVVTFSLFIVQSAPFSSTSRKPYSVPYSYCPVFSLPPGPVPISTFFSASNCLRIAPLAASTITSGLVGEPPPAESAQNETCHTIFLRPPSPTNTTYPDYTPPTARDTSGMHHTPPVTAAYSWWHITER